MIIPVNARMAYDAVARPQGLNGMTFSTQRSAVEKLKKFHEFNIFVDDVAGVCEDQHHMKHYSHKINYNCRKSRFLALPTIDQDNLEQDYEKEEDVKGYHGTLVLVYFLDGLGTQDGVAVGLVDAEEPSQLICILNAFNIVNVIEWQLSFVINDINISSFNQQSPHRPT